MCQTVIADGMDIEIYGEKGKDKWRREKRTFCNFYFQMIDNLFISDTEFIQFKSHQYLVLMFIFFV